MAMADTADRPSVEERYLSASVTSDLTVDLGRRNQGLVVLAAALDQQAHGNQLGYALLHLRAEWDRCNKPRPWTQAEIAARAAQVPDKKGRPDVKRATVEAMVLHARAMRERAASLSGRSVVMGLLTDWAAAQGIDADLLSPALYHWLSPVCPVCDGTTRKPVLYGHEASKQACDHCKGAGEWSRPLGAHEIHEHIKTCLGRAKGGTGRALYG